MKAFMGIKETLEYLETNSVFVCVFDSETLPLFYSNSSKINAQCHASACEIDFQRCCKKLGTYHCDND